MKQSKRKSSPKRKKTTKKTTRKTTRKSTSKKEVVQMPRFGFFKNLFQSNWPEINLSETKTHVKIVANLPGIDPKLIEVDVSDSVVRITGSIAEERQEKDEKFFHLERQYGEFSRDIPLPAKIDTRKVNANSNHGVLTISLKKIEAETPRKLSIRKKK